MRTLMVSLLVVTVLSLMAWWIIPLPPSIPAEKCIVVRDNTNLEELSEKLQEKGIQLNAVTYDGSQKSKRVFVTVNLYLSAVDKHGVCEAYFGELANKLAVNIRCNIQKGKGTGRGQVQKRGQ